MRTILWLSIAVAAILPAHAENTGIDCVRSLEVPKLEHAIVNVEGEVRAVVTISEKGDVGTMSLKSARKDLAHEVEYLLRKQTRYLPACAGKSIEFLFSYVVEGEASDSLKWRVLYQPANNHFTIVSRPVPPSAEYVPRK